MVNILIADDHPLFRAALKGALQHAHTTIFEAQDFEQTEQLINQQPELDLLLLDLHMPGSDDLFGLIRLREAYPDLPIAVVSGSEDLTVIAKVMQYGALGYITKSASVEAIQHAVAAILEGDTWLPQGVAAQLPKLDKQQTAVSARIASLTPQQYKVLMYLHEGLLNKQIAYELNISEATVKAHITAIFRKLDVYNRTQAVLIASSLLLEPIVSQA